MVTFPPRSPPSQPLISDIKISTTEIEQLKERIDRLGNNLEQNRKLIEEIRDIIENQNFISRETFESHRHEYRRPEKMKKFVTEETSTPLE